MAFIRKRGGSYYLVHNQRERGRVRQLHLARLGRRPRIDDDVVRDVNSRHPFLRVDWKKLREHSSRELLQPFANDAQYLKDIITTARHLHLDIADLHLPVLEMTRDRELLAQLISGMRLLRSTLDVKLSQLKKGKFSTLARMA